MGRRGLTCQISFSGQPAIRPFLLLFHAGRLGLPYSHFSGKRRSCVLAVVVGEWALIAGHRLRFSIAFGSLAVCQRMSRLFSWLLLRWSRPGDKTVKRPKTLTPCRTRGVQLANLCPGVVPKSNWQSVVFSGRLYWFHPHLHDLVL